MFASKSNNNFCTVKDSATNEFTNSGRIGNICANPLKNKSEIVNSANYNIYRYVPRLIAPKPKPTTTLQCVIPECSSHGKTNSPKKWYVLPGLKGFTGKDSPNIQRLKALYSKLNIPSKYLGQSVQICSNHFPLKDLQEFNIPLESHTEVCEDRVQHMNEVKLRSINDNTMQRVSLKKINLRREDLSVGQPALNLTQLKCSDGNVHLMCSPSKPNTKQNIPIAYNGVQEQNLSKSPQLTGKPQGQIHLTINKDPRTLEMKSHGVFFNNIQYNQSPISILKPTNSNVIQYKYVSANGEMIDVSVDKNDVHTKNRFHQEKTPPCKNEFQYVDIQNIINSSTTCHASEEEQNSKYDDSESLRKVHTRDVGVQTNDNYDFDEMLHFLRKHVLNYPFHYNNQMFAIENISLFFHPVKCPDKVPVIVHVREHELRATCDKFLKCLNYSLWQKSEKSPNEFPSSYRFVDGLYEGYTENGGLCNTESVNSGNDVMYSKFINTNEDNIFQAVSIGDVSKSGMIASSDKSQCLFSNFEKTIHQINTVRTAVPILKDLNQIVYNNKTYQIELTSPMKNKQAPKNNAFNSIPMIPNSDSLQIMTNNTSDIPDNDQIKFPKRPKIKVIDIANLRNMEEKNVTSKCNDVSDKNAKIMSGISKRVMIEEKKSALRRSSRRKKNINFAKIMKNSLSENYGYVQLNRNSNFNKYSKYSAKKKATVNNDINRKRKYRDANISSKSVDEAGNKKGKYGEMIKELEKFLELTLEQPSEDIVDLLPLEDSYNPDSGFSVSSVCSMNNDKNSRLLANRYKTSHHRKDTLKKLSERNSIRKDLIKTTGTVRNKYQPIKKDGKHSAIPTLMLTRSKTLKDLSQNKQSDKRNELKLRSDNKNSKYNGKSIASPIKHSQNHLAKKFESTLCINETLNNELNLKNYKEICTNCKQLIDKRVLSCHMKICLKKKGCDNCGLMIYNTVMWAHLRTCFQYKCEECGLTFPDVLLLKEHLLTLKDCFLCENCRVIVVGSDINEHLRKCKLPDRTSNIPLKYFSYIYSNNYHYYCKLCMQPFESFLKFTKHVHWSHRKASTNIILMKRKILKKYLQKRSKPNEYKCRFCGYISKNMQGKISHYEACLKQ